MREHIQFDFLYDNHFSEMKDLEILQNKLQAAQMCEPYIGKYFSTYEVRHSILGFTDGQIAETDKQIAYERNVGIIPDPTAGAEAPAEGEEGAEGAPAADGIPAGELPEGADQNGDGVVDESEFTELMDGDMDLSGDPEQEVSRELLRLKKDK